MRYHGNHAIPLIAQMGLFFRVFVLKQNNLLIIKVCFSLLLENLVNKVQNRAMDKTYI